MEQEIQISSTKSILKKNIILNTIFKVLMILAPFITTPYISRVLLSDGVGIFSYTGSLVTYFTMFAALGTISYGTREIAMKRDNAKERSKVFWEIELISIICSAAALIVWITLSLVYKEYRLFLLIFTFSILATCLDISWFYFGLEKYEYTVVINLFFKILSVVLIFVLIKKPDDLWKYILIYSSSLFIGNLSMWLFLPKFLIKTKIDKHSLSKHFKETLVYFVPTIAISLYTVLDKTLIGSLIQGTTVVNVNGEEVVKKTSELESGYYEQATKVVDMIKTVSFASINSVMCSRISYLFKNNNVKDIKKLTMQTFQITLLLSLGAMFGIIGISRVFVPVFFGNGYEKTITLLQILACIVPLICISGVLGSTYYTPFGKRKQSSYFLIAGAVINIILSAPLIIFFKSFGAAIASIIAELVIMILYICYCKKAITIKELFCALWKKLLAGGLMLATILLFNKFIIKYFGSIYLYLVTIILLGLFVYLIALFAFRDESLKSIKMFFFNRFHKKDERSANEEVNN